MRNQPPWKYQNFALWQNYILPSAFDIWVGLYISFTSCHACTTFSWGIQCEDTLFKPPQICPTQTIPGIDDDTTDVDSVVDFRMGEVDQRIFGLSAAAQLKKYTPHRGLVSVWAVQP